MTTHIPGDSVRDQTLSPLFGGHQHHHRLLNNGSRKLTHSPGPKKGHVFYAELPGLIVVMGTITLSLTTGS